MFSESKLWTVEERRQVKNWMLAFGIAVIFMLIGEIQKDAKLDAMCGDDRHQCLEVPNEHEMCIPGPATCVRGSHWELLPEFNERGK